MNTQYFIEQYLMTYPGDIPEDMLKQLIQEFEIIKSENNPDLLDEWLISFPNKLKKLIGQ